jgi:hypothetical protein
LRFSGIRKYSKTKTDESPAADIAINSGLRKISACVRKSQSA